MTNSSLRVFSGIQPTGDLHLGNYLGAIVNWVAMQETHECIFCIVDLHAITMRHNPKLLATQTRELTAALIASGVDPERAILFNQSAVPMHAQLAWILQCVARVGWLDRMTQYKEKRGRDREGASVGLYTYPVLQAADILGYKATHVPVGEDQKQHLELARDIAQKFNADHGVDLFPLPEPFIQGRGNPCHEPARRNGEDVEIRSERDEPDRARGRCRYDRAQDQKGEDGCGTVALRSGGTGRAAGGGESRQHLCGIGGNRSCFGAENLWRAGVWRVQTRLGRPGGDEARTRGGAVPRAQERYRRARSCVGARSGAGRRHRRAGSCRGEARGGILAGALSQDRSAGSCSPLVQSVCRKFAAHSLIDIVIVRRNEIMKLLQTSLLAGGLTLLAACATPFTADVSRFQQLPAPQGETYAIVAMGDEETDSLEFQTYAQQVAAQMSAQGYSRAASPETASLVVSLDYGVNDGREKIASRPGSRFGYWGGYGYGYPGYFGFRRPLFYDPFYYSGFGRGYDNDVYSYTVYRSFLDMEIKRASGEPVFEGRAEAVSRNDNLPEVVPKLVTAMFTDFPGMSGRTVRVKVPSDR